jgi:hypothetical protein
MIGARLGVIALSGGGVNPDFVSTWDTTQAGSASDTVILPLLSGGTYNGTIDWGDGGGWNIHSYTTWFILQSCFRVFNQDISELECIWNNNVWFVHLEMQDSFNPTI